MKIGKKGKLALQGCGFLVFLGVLGLVCLGYYADQVGPDDYLGEGREIRPKDVLRVRELGILEPDETMLMFYSWGLLDISEGCFVLTDRHLITYCKFWKDPVIKRPIDQMTSARMSSGSLMKGKIIVTFDDGTALSYEITKQMSGDKRFLAKLTELIEAAQNPKIE